MSVSHAGYLWPMKTEMVCLVHHSLLVPSMMGTLTDTRLMAVVDECLPDCMLILCFHLYVQKLAQGLSHSRYSVTISYKMNEWMFSPLITQQVILEPRKGNKIINPMFFYLTWIENFNLSRISSFSSLSRHMKFLEALHFQFSSQFKSPCSM